MTTFITLVATLAQLRLIWVMARKHRMVVRHWNEMAELAGAAITELPFPDQQEMKMRATRLVIDQVNELRRVTFWGWG